MHVFYLDDAQLRARVAAGDDVALWFLKFGVPLSGAKRWKTLRKSLLNTRPRVNHQKKFDLARRQLKYANDLLDMGDHDAAQEELQVGAEHLARGLLLETDRFPGSRPEIPAQLRSAGYVGLAHLLEELRTGDIDARSLAEAIKLSTDLVRKHDRASYAQRLRGDPGFGHS